MKMKKTSVLKILSSAAIIACITVLFATTASAKKTGLEGYRTGYVNTDALKLREEASASASVSSLLMEMQQVTILSEKDGFYHISVPGEGQLDGWVKKEYVCIND